MTDIKTQFNHSTLNAPKFIYGGKTINKYLGAIPFIPQVFLGREEDLTAIHDKLFNDNNLLLLVNGEGGIGKTTLASKYYQEYHEEYIHLAWVFAEKSLRDAILTLSYPLQVTYPEKMTEDEQLQALLCEMAELNKPCLLVIDNANSLDDLESHYHALKACPNFHLLLTTRITEFENAETHAIKPLDEKNAIALFTRLYQDHTSKEDNVLRQILQAVGYNTLVIELLAKNLGNFNNKLRKRYSLVDLLGDLQKKGLFGLSKSNTINTAYKGDGLGLRKEKPENILAAMYNLAELEEAEKAMLSVFALFPAEPLAFGTLEELLPGTENLDTTLLNLARKGWIEFMDTTNCFKCSPVVQEVTRIQNKDELFEHCELLITTLAEKLEYEPGTGHLPNVCYDKGSLYTRYAESICRFRVLLRNSAIISLLLDRVGNFHKTTGNLDKALTFFDERSRLGKELYEAYPQNVSFKNGLAISYSKLGETHSALGNLDKALTFFDDETLLFEELYEAYPQNVSFKNGLAISYSKLGETHSALGNLDKALTFFDQDAQLSKELYEAYPQNVSFKNGLAISYSKLGETHSALGNLDKALTFFDDETLLFEELYEAYPQNVSFKNGLAISYSKLGETHSALGNLDKALTFFDDETLLFEELYEAYPQNVSFKNGLAISYSKLGETHSALGNLDKALTFFDDETLLFEELYEAYPQNVSFKNGLAISYSKLGETHSALGNLDKALTFFDQDAQLSKELYEAYPQNVSFKNGLAISYSKLGETHSALGNLDKALTFFDERSRLGKELYEAYPQNVSFKNGLAISNAKLGIFYRDERADSVKARQYLEQAEALWCELVKSYPSSAEFQKNWSSVKDNLNTL